MTRTILSMKVRRIPMRTKMINTRINKNFMTRVLILPNFFGFMRRNAGFLRMTQVTRLASWIYHPRRTQGVLNILIIFFLKRQRTNGLSITLSRLNISRLITTGTFFSRTLTPICIMKHRKDVKNPQLRRRRFLALTHKMRIITILILTTGTFSVTSIITSRKGGGIRPIITNGATLTSILTTRSFLPRRNRRGDILCIIMRNVTINSVF